LDRKESNHFRDYNFSKATEVEDGPDLPLISKSTFPEESSQRRKSDGKIEIIHTEKNVPKDSEPLRSEIQSPNNEYEFQILGSMPTTSIDEPVQNQ
jgi:hypothetical protein